VIEPLGSISQDCQIVRPPRRTVQVFPKKTVRCPCAIRRLIKRFFDAKREGKARKSADFPLLNWNSAFEICLEIYTYRYYRESTELVLSGSSVSFDRSQVKVSTQG